ANIRESVKKEKERTAKSAQKRELAEKLAASVEFELPESVVQEETRDVVYDIVAENQARGVSQEILEEKKNEIFENATRSAKDLVKLNFILRRIAEEEKIEVTEAELSQYLQYLAMQQQTPVEKLAKRMVENGAISQVERRILSQKVIDFVLEQAKVEAQ
ncbi:MAG: trigger factor, partial [Verrucomicrobium sp.]|nr:trigger factor [Verrucomicrobium sp.]